MSDFAKALDHALWQKRIDQNAFAKSADVATSSVSRWRSGKGKPGLDEFVRACAVLPELRAWFNAQMDPNGDDAAWCEDLKERDEALELIADVARHFGCTEEWSNAHDHRDCVREYLS